MVPVLSVRQPQRLAPGTGMQINSSKTRVWHVASSYNVSVSLLSASKELLSKGMQDISLPMPCW